MDDRDREDVKMVLERLGYQVRVLPTVKDEKRPDLLAIRGDTRMFVEVKTRVQDSTLRAAMEAVPLGATESILTPIKKHNALSAEIKDANEQLGTLASHGDHRLLWLRAHNDLFVHGARDQVVSTLLGIRVVDAERDGSRRHFRCAYAGFADFFRFREIDGAMIEKGDALTLVLNQFSDRHVAFSASHICNVLPSGAVVDVGQAARDGDCYVVDGDIDRKDDEAVLEFLRAKHPQHQFHGFLQHTAGTTVTVIDAAAARPPNTPLQSDRPSAGR